MIDPTSIDHGLVLDSILSLPWLPECGFDGPEQIPMLAPNRHTARFPSALVSFDRLGSTIDRSTSLLHFFVGDSRLRRLVRDPIRYLDDFATYQAIATPDFSLYRSMPRHQKVMSTVLNRAFGVLYQSRGLDVIATARWSSDDDYDFAFAGIPTGSAIVVSNHGCWRSRHDKEIFEHGLREAARSIAPSRILFHGRAPRDSALEDLADQAIEFSVYPSRIETEREKGDVRGRR